MVRTILTPLPCECLEDGIVFGGKITYEQLSMVVDYLRSLKSNMTEDSKSLFEKCWITYRRKGSKKKSVEYWNRLTDEKRARVLPHIKAYIASREIQYQKDFERYLRDETFNTIIFGLNNTVVYDPSKIGAHKKISDVYMPTCEGALSWNDYYKCYMYSAYFSGRISDGYSDDDRPDGASVTLNNGRGEVRWSCETKSWNLV